MKRSLLIICALFGVLFFSCKKKEAFTIKGTLSNAGSLKKVYLLEADSTAINVVDSTALGSDGSFQFKHSTPFANLYKLRAGGSVFDLVAKNGDDISFNASLTAADHSYQIAGSEDSEKIKDFNKVASYYGDKNNKLADEYQTKLQKIGHESDSLMKVYMPEFERNLGEYSQKVLNFVNENKNSLAGFYAATSLDQYKYEQQLVAYADQIKDNFKDNPAVQRFKRQMEAIKPISVGHKAPDFTVQGINGKPIKLSDYKGKYVMLDFWASWCGPCRQENPNVVKQYHKFNSKGFNILGISLDTEKKDWQQAIKSDGLAWAHGSDLKKFDGPVELAYHIEAIPSNFIIDPNGIIVAKNVTGADLEDFLNKTFK